MFVCNLKSPHVQVCYAMGKELPPIAEDVGDSQPSHMHNATGSTFLRQRSILAQCCVMKLPGKSLCGQSRGLGSNLVLASQRHN
jgi:hypothetical protein